MHKYPFRDKVMFIGAPIIGWTFIERMLHQMIVTTVGLWYYSVTFHNHCSQVVRLHDTAPLFAANHRT